jgi:hypothetical protein
LAAARARVLQARLAMAELPPASVRSRMAWRALLALGVASVGASLAMRIVHRGTDVPGWDILLTVHGQYLLATRGFWGAFEEIMVKVRTFWLPPSAYSVPYGLIPGGLASWWPSVLWQPAVVFLAWLTTLALLLVATGWRASSPRGWAVALLAWGASPSLLSYSVEGYPWGAGMLPHALALALALSERPWRWWTTLLALALVWELPWHGYEIGKTAGLTLLACAVFAPKASLGRRLAWAATGATAIVAVWRIWPSVNMKALGHGNVGTGVGLFRAVADVPDGFVRLWETCIGWHPLIVPVLAVAGVIALPWMGTRRNALAASWLVQVVLIVLLAAAGANLLRPRRFQAVDVMSIAALLAAMRVAPARVCVGLAALLLAGNVWTLAEGIRFTHTPQPFSLPGVQSAEGVGVVDRPAIAWADRLAARARDGERVVVLHGQMCPTEDVTNPVGILERLYVTLGHDVFRSRVLAVGFADNEESARYVTVPVVDVRTAVDTLSPGTIVDLDRACAEKMAPVKEALAERFALVPLDPAEARFLQYRLEKLRTTSNRGR